MYYFVSRMSPEKYCFPMDSGWGGIFIDYSELSKILQRVEDKVS